MPEVAGVDGYARCLGRRGACCSRVARAAAIGANRLLRTTRPERREVDLGRTSAGLDPVGGDWAQAQIRYYVYAYLYVLFAVEAVFLFPWAMIFDRPGFGADRGRRDGHLRRAVSPRAALRVAEAGADDGREHVPELRPAGVLGRPSRSGSC